MSHATPQEFPSDFPIKVMGRHDSDLRALTQTIIERHAGPEMTGLGTFHEARFIVPLPFL